MKKVLISLSQPPVLVVKDADDPMDVLIKCPYCGTLTKVGDTRMISGFVGCDIATLFQEVYLRQHCLFEKTIMKTIVKVGFIKMDLK